MRHGGSEMAFNDFILLRLQAWARMVPWRAYRRALRDPVLNAAASSIQKAWRGDEARRARAAAAAATVGPSGVGGARPPRRRRATPSAGRAAFLLQRAWRGFTNRRIFQYLREMLLFREQGDARALLRGINPREAMLIDEATAIHVRFRLGGELFPPAIFYNCLLYTSPSPRDS